MPYTEFKLGGGVNLKSAASDIRDDQLQEAEGCRFDRTGAVSSERGRERITDLNAEIRGTVEVIRDDAKKRIAKAGESLFEGTTSIGTFSGTGFLRGVSVADRAYLADGTNLGTWDGTTLLTTIGIVEPTVAPTLSVASGGSLTADATYKVAYTFVILKNSGEFVAESNFSPTADGAPTGANLKISVDAVETPPTGVTHVRLYRSDRNKTPLFFIEEITVAEAAALGTTPVLMSDAEPEEADGDSSAGDDVRDIVRTLPELLEAGRQDATFECSTAMQTRYPGLCSKSAGPLQQSGGQQVVMTNLGVLADWTDHDPAPSGLRGLIQHQGQLFGISGNDVVFARVNEPEHWPIFNRFQPGRKASEELRAILPLGGNLVLYTDSNIYVFQPVGLSFEDGRIIDMHSPVGIAGQQVVAPILIGAEQEAGHIFLAKSGVYVFDGTRIREISFQVEDIFTDPAHSDYINQTTIANARIFVHRDKVFLSYSNSGGDNDRTLFIDFQDTQNPKMSISKLGYSSLALEKKELLPIGGDVDGIIYQVDDGGSDAGADLDWKVRTKQYPLTTNNTLVALETLVLDADFGGLLTTITVRTDAGRSVSFTDQSSGRSRITRDLPHSIKGRRVDVEVSSSGQAERHWYGIGFNFRPGVEPHG